MTVHDGTFDGPDKKSLQPFLDSRIAAVGQGPGAEQLLALKNALI